LRNVLDDLSISSKNLYKINLGYLKVDHYYKVAFDLKHDYNEVNLLKEESSDHVQLKEIKHENGNLNFTFIFYAFKEKLDEEEVSFNVKTVNNQNEFLKFNFEARVLGSQQGTPLLRNGITLLHKKTLGHSDEKNHFNVN